MSSNPASRKRPDIIAFAKEMQARYPHVLAHLAASERADFSTAPADPANVTPPDEDQETRI